MTIYEPAEDSYLLMGEVEKSLKEFRPEQVMDMGSGSGIQADAVLKSGVDNENIFCVDINPEAVGFLREKFQNVIESDLFEKVPEMKFDLIIFNPPYLPKDKDEPEDSQVATTGGEKGGEIVNKFLEQAKAYLSSKGRILLLVSSLTQGVDFSNYEKKEGRSAYPKFWRKRAKKKIFFEELIVLELWAK